MSTLAQLRDLRRRLAESDRLRSTVEHAADVAALDALLGAVEARSEARARLDAANATLLASSTIPLDAPQAMLAPHRSALNACIEALHAHDVAEARVGAILRGES